MFTIRGLFQDFQQFGQQAGNRILVLCRVEVAVDDGFSSVPIQLLTTGLRNGCRATRLPCAMPRLSKSSAAAQCPAIVFPWSANFDDAQHIHVVGFVCVFREFGHGVAAGEYEGVVFVFMAFE